MHPVINKVRESLFDAIDSDKLVLPTLPEVALRVREVAEDPEADISTLSQVIGNDAALTARIIKVANSPLLRASREIEDLKMALMRLGMEYTCNLATGLAMEQMFQATSDIVDKRLRDTWESSSEIAGICHVLCRSQRHLRPDQATLAGLVHRIGVLPILTFAESHPNLLTNSMVLDQVIDALHPELGDKILAKWDFPQDLAKVPSEHMDFGRAPPQADYADVVTVAMLQNYAGSDHPMGKIDLTEVLAFERMGIAPNFDEEDEDLNAEMEAAMLLLQG